MFPELFRIGNFFLPTYGLLVALAFLTALMLTGRLAHHAGLDREAVLNVGIYSALAGIIGAKLLMILLDLNTFLANPREILSLSTLQAGGVFYGGLLAALVTAFLYMRRKRLPVLATLDVFAPGLALGHAIGRLGCFAAGCCWGLETRLPWAVKFTDPRANRLVGVPLETPLHPTQLYESLAELVIFAVLFRFFKKPHRDGAVISLYLILYSAARFLVEFVRAHEQPNPFGGPLSNAQWISLGLIVGGVIYWVRARKYTPVQARV